MRTTLYLLGCLFLFSPVMAQETTYGGRKPGFTPEAENMPNVLVISFEDKMYRSDVDREIGMHNGMDQGQVMHFFQKALPATITSEFASHYNILPFNSVDPDSNAMILSFIHRSLNYEYDILKEEPDSTKGHLNIKLERKAASPGKSGLIDGQVVTRQDNREKYMKATIENDTLISFLQKQYEFDYLLLISELDVTYFVENPDMAAYGGIKKEIKTHYTIYSGEGKMIESNAKKVYLDNNEKDITLIASKSLPDLASQILVSFRRKVDKNLN